ncbi:hypothetical protein WMF18_12145 [Sorangium sp. So ce315]
MEPVHLLAVRRQQGEVHARHRPAVARRDEQLVGGEAARGLDDDVAPEHLQHRTVEALAPPEVGDAEMDMVDQPTHVKLHGESADYGASQGGSPRARGDAALAR